VYAVRIRATSYKQHVQEIFPCLANSFECVIAQFGLMTQYCVLWGSTMSGRHQKVHASKTTSKSWSLPNMKTAKPDSKIDRCTAAGVVQGVHKTWSTFSGIWPDESCNKVGGRGPLLLHCPHGYSSGPQGSESAAMPHPRCSTRCRPLV
jgi:hypothetical protein